MGLPRYLMLIGLKIWHQGTSFPRGRAAGLLAVLATFALCKVSFAAELPGSADSSTSIAKVEQLFRQAGSSSADLARLHKELQDASPKDIAEYAEKLRKQSPDELVKTVAQFRLDGQYSLGSDSQQHSDVPEGTIQAFVLADSKIFPSFEHKWWLYIPAQYRSPAPPMVFLDGDGS
jgi:hypothetical protein